jgi:hypothetical protein
MKARQQHVLLRALVTLWVGKNGLVPSPRAESGRAQSDGLGPLSSNQTQRFCKTEVSLIATAPCTGALLSYVGHCVMVNLSILVVNSEVNQDTDMAERDAAGRIVLLLKGAHQKTLSTGMGYDIPDSSADLRIRRS